MAPVALCFEFAFVRESGRSKHGGRRKLMLENFAFLDQVSVLLQEKG
jgi:hypothetical protein